MPFHLGARQDDRGRGEKRLIRPAPDGGPVFPRYSKQPADGGDRDPDGKFLHEIDGFRSGSPSNVDEADHELTGHVVEVARHAVHGPRGEAAHGQRAEVEVLRTVGVEHVEGDLGVPAVALGPLGPVRRLPCDPVVGVEADHAGAGEQLGMAGDIADVAVAGDGPEWAETGAALVAVNRGPIA
jgi:hypothetical protein